MTFRSILFRRVEDSRRAETAEMPEFFADLNLDQIVETITAGKEDYDLKPFFFTAMTDLDSVLYRHEVMRDLEDKTLFELVKTFAKNMRLMREHLAQADKLYYRYQKERWVLDAVRVYCDTVTSFAEGLAQVELKSRGFVAFREYLARYLTSSRFTALLSETEALEADLRTVSYCLLIRGNRVTVRKYDAESDYSIEVEKTFEKFQQGAVKDYRVRFRTMQNMNHVEAQILDLVARLYPEVFSALDRFCAKNSGYLDETIGIFDREIQFYIAYLEYTLRFKAMGLRFCFPHLSTQDKAVFDHEGFDLALANKLILENAPVVCNDFDLQDPERIFVVTGPNQGGKTTFARMFGQLHYLACIGVPVPGREAHLFLFDRLFTHFEKEETIENLRGKLQDDLVRIRSVLTQSTSNSIVIMNEIFTSTTLQDAVFLSKHVMEQIIRLDLLCVCVTFIDELASLSEKTVSVVSTVVPDNPAQRTYKIVRRPADGLAYALSVAEKHGLTYDRLKERMKS